MQYLPPQRLLDNVYDFPGDGDDDIGSYSSESLAGYPGKKWREPTLTEEELLAQLAVKPRPLEAGETARGVATGFENYPQGLNPG